MKNINKKVTKHKYNNKCSIIIIEFRNIKYNITSNYYLLIAVYINNIKILPNKVRNKL